MTDMLYLPNRVTFAMGESTCAVIGPQDVRQSLRQYAGQVDLLMTSPPYADARAVQYGGVPPDQYVKWFLTFHDVFWNALTPQGSLVINIKDKVVNGVRHRYVWRTIEALADLGWHCIDDYIWHKTNSMPGAWPTRLRDGWEYCFHLAKQPQPYFNPNGVLRPVSNATTERVNRLKAHEWERHNSANGSGFGKNLSHWVGKTEVAPDNVLVLATETQNVGHPAAYPIDLPRFFIRLLCPIGGCVADPFAGSGTTGVASLQEGRHGLLFESQADYINVAVQRLRSAGAVWIGEVTQKPLL